MSQGLDSQKIPSFQNELEFSTLANYNVFLDPLFLSIQVDKVSQALKCLSQLMKV